MPATPVVQTQQFAASTGPVQVPAPRDPLPVLLYVVAALTALLAIFGPPALGIYLKTKPKTNTGVTDRLRATVTPVRLVRRSSRSRRRGVHERECRRVGASPW